MAKIVVIGGGITGLSAAYMAARAGHKVRLYEAAGSFGGLLHSFAVGGTNLEIFYHHFFTHDVELQWLLRELSLLHKLKFYDSSMGFYSKGNIYNFNGALDLLRFSPLNFSDKIRFGLSALYISYFSNWRACEDVSALDWFYRHAGKKVTDVIWKPMLTVKFGSYADQVPLSWMVGRLKQRFRSRQQGDEKLGYIDGSLKIVVDALTDKLKTMGVEMYTNAPVTSLQATDHTLTAIKVNDKEIRADSFLFTIPTTTLSKLVAEVDSTYENALKQIDYFGAVCVILEMKKPLNGQYWLNVADVNSPFGGIIEHTNLVPPKDYNGLHIAYLSRYFSRQDAISRMTDEEVKSIMLNYLPQVVPSFLRDNILQVHIFRSYTAAPVCDLNFSSKVPTCISPLQNMYVANMTHVYPDERSTNNAIRVAAEACRCMGMDTSYVPEGASMAGQIGFCH